jgi:hypothetical protein
VALAPLGVATVDPTTYAVDLLKYANLSVAGPGFAPDFLITIDVAVLASVVACLQFWQELRDSALIHALAKKGRR